MTTTVAALIASQGTELLDTILVGDIDRFQSVLDKKLRKSEKIYKFCTTEIRHKTRKETFTPAGLAVNTGNADIVRYMLAHGLSPNHGALSKGRFTTEGSLLLQAVTQGAMDTADVLMSAGADTNLRDMAGEVPLHVAVRKLNAPMVRLLLSRGADPCLLDRLGDPPLHAATHSGHLMVVSALLKHNADVYQKGRTGTIAPQIAAREGHAHVLELFCKNSGLCCDINVCVPCFGDGRAKAPLHIAAERGHHESLFVLVAEYNADIHVVDSDKNTALHYLVLRPYSRRKMREMDAYLKSAAILIEGGANVNAKNQFGDICLHLAVMNGYQSVVQYLLENGADPTAENKLHMTPSDVVFETDSVTKQALRNAKKKILALRAVEDLGGKKQKQPDFGNPFDPLTWGMNQTMDIDDEFMLGPSASRVGVPEESLISERRARSRSTSRSLVSSVKVGKKKKRSKSVDVELSRTERPAQMEGRLMIDHTANGDQILRDIHSGQVFVPIVSAEEADNMSNISKGSKKKQKKARKEAAYASLSHDSAPASPTRKVLQRQGSVDYRDTQGRYHDSSLSQVSSLVSSLLSQQPSHAGSTAVDHLFTYNNGNIYTEMEDPVDKTGTGHAKGAMGGHVQEQEISQPNQDTRQKKRKPKKIKKGETKQADSVKVSMIPGKPGALEVEYGGKTLEICVDQDQRAKPETTTLGTYDVAARPKVAPKTLPKPSKDKTKFVHKAQVHAEDPAQQLANIINRSQQLVPNQSQIRETLQGDQASDTDSFSWDSESWDSEAETVVPSNQQNTAARPTIKIGMRKTDQYQDTSNTFV